MLVSKQLLRKSGVVFIRVKNVWRKKLGKITVHIGIKVIPRYFCPAFSFPPVLIQRRSSFGKSYVNSKLQVSKK